VAVIACRRTATTTCGPLSTASISCHKIVPVEPKEVINALLTGRYDEIHDAGADGFRRAIPASEIQKVWQATTSRFGEPTRVSDGVVLHDLGLTFANGEAHVQIAYRDGKITGMVIRPGPPTAKFGQ